MFGVEMNGPHPITSEFHVNTTWLRPILRQCNNSTQQKWT